MNASFSGFAALPSGATDGEAPHWSHVLGVDRGAWMSEIVHRHRELVKRYHPDNAETGDADRFRAIQAAYTQAKADRI